MKRKLTVLICAAMAMCLALGSFAGCTKNKISNESTAFVIMSEELDGVFNPFFYTAGADGEVVGMTQISMLSSNDKGEVAYGNSEPSVVLDYDSTFVEGTSQNQLGRYENGKWTGETTYTFVLKNGIKFSDGVPLTIRDVLFNMYVYLDPVYTGSTTMYSTDIVGLNEYRTQSTATTEEQIERDATVRARTRLTNLIDAVNTIIEDGKPSQGNPGVVYTIYPEDNMRAALISKYDADNQFVKDYNRIRELFRKEVEDDYKGAIEAYKDAPYYFNDVEGFMYSEGFVEWDKKTESVKNWNYPRPGQSGEITTREAAIDYVERANMPTKFAEIASSWGTAGEILTEFIAEAKEEALSGGSGDRKYKNISGITALDGRDNSTVTVNGNTYNVAALPEGNDMGDLNADWSVKDESKHQVLQIKINGVDPKAIWNFGFTVAPLHYYSDSEHINSFSIENDSFGVQYSSLEFMNNVLKGGNKVGVPVGAGPYKATDRNGSANPEPGAFKADNIVYFTRNDDFLMGKPKIKLVRYQVINQSQSINVVKSGAVHYTMPQATKTNMDEINGDKKVLEYVQNVQLGYGYIGVNAGKIPDVNLRRAIMSACDTSLCMQYYTGTAQKLAWPMSKVSWAYPRLNFDDEYSYDDNYRYPYGANDAETQATVMGLMGKAGVKSKSGVALKVTGKTNDGLDQYEDAYYNGKQLKFTFTIAGANLSEHPTYNTFKKAADILNACGWDIDVRADNYTLTKLATGALDVWAAAWSTTIDPDMYQVYHRNSKATSVLNWGYRELKSGQSSNGYGAGTLSTDYKTIVEPLSKKIDEGRKTDDRRVRADIYRECLSLVMDLAVELPTYQKNNIYLYNKNVVDGSTLNKSNSAFTNPLSRIWEVSLKEN